MRIIELVARNIPRGKYYLTFGSYQNDTTAIQILDNSEGFLEPMTTATTCIEGYPLKEGYILIKNWSENEGILEGLIAAGIIEDTGKKIPTGFAEANLCKLLVNPEPERSTNFIL